MQFPVALDLGVTPATPASSAAPVPVMPGARPQDFAAALTGLLTGAAPAALSTGITLTRPAHAAPGKTVPDVARSIGAPAPLVAAPLPECVLPDPDALPAPSDPAAPLVEASLPDCVLPDPDAPPAIGEPISAAPEAKGERAELPEPGTDPALAWLLPPVTPAAITPPASAATSFVVGTLPPAPAGKLPVDRRPADTDCDTPANGVPASAAADRQAVVLPVVVAIRPDVAVTTQTLTAAAVTAAPACAPAPGSSVLAPTADGRQTPHHQDTAIARPVARALAPSGEGVTTPIVPLPARRAPELKPADIVVAVQPDTASMGPSEPAPFATSAPAAAAVAVAPASSAQQAGIDLSRDSGLHRMLDRIEQLREAVDVRETRIRLIPDALGPVDIAVRREGTSEAVQVHFTATEAATRQLIADAQPRLIELAEARGLRIERATVDGGGSQAGDGNSRQQAHPPPQPQPRGPVRATREPTSETADQRIA